MQKFFMRTFLTIYFCDQKKLPQNKLLQKWIVKKNCAHNKSLQKINRQKNCAQNKALQKCAADIFVYLLVERGKTLSAAHGAH